GRFAHAFLDSQGAALAKVSPVVAAHRFLNATTAHNDWIQVVTESGPPGAILLACVMAIAWRALRGWPAAPSPLIVVAVAAAGDSPLRQPAVVVVLCLVLAATATPGLRRNQMAFAGMTLAALAPLLAVATATWLGARTATLARDRGAEERIALLDRAARIDP